MVLLWPSSHDKFNMVTFAEIVVCWKLDNKEASFSSCNSILLSHVSSGMPRDVNKYGAGESFPMLILSQGTPIVWMCRYLAYDAYKTVESLTLTAKQGAREQSNRFQTQDAINL